MKLEAKLSSHASSLPKRDVNDNQHNRYLCEYSKRDQIWDIHKAQADEVAHSLEQGEQRHIKQAKRIEDCALSLEFGWVPDFESGELILKLKRVWFCRVRHCPICQWRRSLMWIARLYAAFPKIYADHPDWRYILVTFTVKNCPITELQATIGEMSKAWHRLIKRKDFPGIGFIRALEVTKQISNGYAHPHYHCLLVVNSDYFGRNYLSTAKWAKLWQEALKVDYTPICDARIVKPNPKKAKLEANAEPYAYVFAAIKEVLKYTVKPDDMLDDPQWLIALTDQLKKTRAVAIGGELRQYLKTDDEESNQDLIAETGTTIEDCGKISFGWRDQIRKYQRKSKQALITIDQQ